MASAMILKRMGRLRLLAYALLAFGDKVAAALEARYRPFLEEGETMPSFGMILTLFARSMKDYSKKLSFADISRLDELDEDFEYREQLSDATENVRQLLINARETIRYVYGKSALKKFGFQRRTGHVPIVLSEQGRRIVGNLRDPEKFEGLKPRVKATVDLPGQAAEIEAALDALDLHSNQFELERRKTIETKIQKDSTMDVFDDSFVPQARILEGLFHVAGFRKLAARIRPTIVSGTGRDIDTEGLEELEKAFEESLAQAAAMDVAAIESPEPDPVDNPEPPPAGGG